MSRSDDSAYPPMPAVSEHSVIAREMIRESDELPWMVDEEPEPDPTWPVHDVHPHVHQLCGHDCLSAACESELNAICMACELVLQDARDPRPSYGMNRSE